MKTVWCVFYRKDGKKANRLSFIFATENQARNYVKRMEAVPQALPNPTIKSWVVLGETSWR